MSVSPAAADSGPVLVPIPTTYHATWNHAGGTGDVRASWRNDGPAIASFGVTAEAPPHQFFHWAGTLTVYVLDPATGVWNIAGQPVIEDDCTISADATDFACASLSIDVPNGQSLAISIPTFVAPQAPVTGVASVDSGATARIEVGGTVSETAEWTAVASSDVLALSTTFPTAGDRVVTGRANPGTTVTIESASGTALGSIQSDAQSQWTIVLAPGFGAIRSRFETLDGTPVAGDPGYYNTYVFAVDSPSDGAAWSASTVATGSGQPGSRLVVSDESGGTIAEGQVDATGAWAIPVPALPPGPHDLVIANTISDGSTTSLHVRGVSPESPPPAPPAPYPPATAPSAGPAQHVVLTTSVSSGTAVADGEDVHVLRVVIIGPTGHPLAGERVFFTAPNGLTLSSTSALTDVRGVATTTVTASRQIASRVSVSGGGITATTPLVVFGVASL